MCIFHASWGMALDLHFHKALGFGEWGPRQKRWQQAVDGQVFCSYTLT